MELIDLYKLLLAFSEAKLTATDFELLQHFLKLSLLYNTQEEQVIPEISSMVLFF
jgi:hypothetical protein